MSATAGRVNGAGNRRNFGTIALAAGGVKPPKPPKPPKGVKRPKPPKPPKSVGGRGGYGGGRPAGPVRPSLVPSVPNILLLIITIVLGPILWIAEKPLYNFCTAGGSLTVRPFIIGAIFGLLCLVLGLAVLGYGILTEQSDHDLCSSLVSLIVVLAGSLAVFLLAALFQWIYGLNFTKQMTEPTSYIFIIDDSGSMAGSDPEGKRYDTVAEVLEEMDENFSYMVYSFSDDPEVLREMAPISDGIPALSGSHSGGTAIKGVLTQVMDDYDVGEWDGGASPKVILLSDGVATDILDDDIKSLLKRYTKAGISISTVGLGSSVDESMMEKIASSTGGVYINVDDAVDLSEAMESAAVSYADRDLLSERHVSRLNWFYGILRVLFLTILGVLVGGIAIAAYGHSDGSGVSLIVTAATSFVGALLMEFLVTWLLLWILFTATLVFKKGKAYGPQRRDMLVR